MTACMMAAASIGGLAAANVNAVHFDGSTYLSLASDLNGNADSNKLTGLGWFKPTSAVMAASQCLYRAQTTVMGGAFGTGFEMTIGGPGNRFNIAGTNSSGTNILSLASNNDSVATSWTSLLFSFDLSDVSKRHLYLNGSNSLNVNTYTSGNIDFTQTKHSIGGGNSTNPYFGDMAEFWLFPGTYVDLSSSSNRHKFINNLNKPVDLGASGMAPTGSTPLIYETGVTASWHTNSGTGGGFALTGALTTASTTPSS